MFCTIMVPYDMCFEPPKGRIMTGVDIAIEFFFISEMVTILLSVDKFILLSVDKYAAPSARCTRDCLSVRSRCSD